VEREAQTPEKEKKKAVRRAGNMDVKNVCDGNISDQYDTINATAIALGFIKSTFARLLTLHVLAEIFAE
jgi:hypothetical protein